MSFTNLQLDETALPDAGSLAFRPMADNYVREVRTQQWITWAPLALIAAIPSLLVVRPEVLKLGLLLPPSVLVVLGLVFGPLAVMRARIKAYAVREHDIALRSGLYFRKTVILPLDRVQHAEVSEGPLQRRFGLSSLKLYTAGGTSVDLRIDGLERSRAEALREHILARAES